MAQPMPKVVIAGGGIIGSSCAYFLAQKGVKPIVIEACTPACSASGKAGGFLALDWCDSSALGPLARRSFALHATLAQTLGSDCGYRKVKTHSITMRKPSKHTTSKSGASRVPRWVNTANIVQDSVIGTDETTAQVHPKLLTTALLKHATQQGGSVRPNTRVIGVETSSESGFVTGVRIQNTETQFEEVIPADAVIFALGVWSSSLHKILPSTVENTPQISGQKVHSIIIEDPQGKATPDALFLSYSLGDVPLEPEVYPRPDDTVYVCGVASEEAPPALADDIVPRPEAIATLRNVAASVSSGLGTARVLHEQACFLPCTDDGLPVIGAVPGLPGAYLATGHSCWGILNGPATGLAIAELIVEGESSVDISAFSVERFDNML